MTFPRTVGQVPIYYNYYNTGRPARNDSDLNYVSAYIDLPNSPRFPFGYGLSYTTFSYSDIRLSKTVIRPGEKLDVIVTVQNSGNHDGHEVVQLYTRDLVGSVVRPVKELKGFQKIFLKKGEAREVRFTITTDDLRFYNDKLQFIYEPGDFHVFVGGNSRDVKQASFSLK
jgi:beta-glucosidase